jgi:hypothetical protein
MAPSEQTRACAPAFFEYSNAEWAEIDAALVASRALPLSARARQSLLDAAFDYHCDVRDRLNGDRTKWSPKARAEKWDKVERVCRELCTSLEGVGRPEGVLLPVTALALTEESLLAHAGSRDGRESVRLDDLIRLVTALKESAASTAAECRIISRLGPFCFYSYTGRVDPSVVYLQRILWFWTDIMGGNLSFSRKGSSESYSPCVRFLFASARPVMKRKTPSLESVPSVLKRQKEFYRWLDGYCAEHKTERAALAEGRLMPQDCPWSPRIAELRATLARWDLVEITRLLTELEKERFSCGKSCAALVRADIASLADLNLDDRISLLTIEFDRRCAEITSSRTTDGQLLLRRALSDDERAALEARTDQLRASLEPCDPHVAAQYVRRFFSGSNTPAKDV